MRKGDLASSGGPRRFCTSGCKRGLSAGEDAKAADGSRWPFENLRWPRLPSKMFQSDAHPHPTPSPSPRQPTSGSSEAPWRERLKALNGSIGYNNSRGRAETTRSHSRPSKPLGAPAGASPEWSGLGVPLPNLSPAWSNQGRLPPGWVPSLSSRPLSLHGCKPAHLHVDRACHHGCWGQLKLKKREEIYAKLLIAFVCNEIIQYSSDYRI